MAVAISIILGVPCGSASMARASPKPTTMASRAVPAANNSQNHSLLVSSNTW